MGQLPILEVDGLPVVHQSIAIARYAARRVGLAGANDWESLIIDVAVDTINDFRLSRFYWQLGIYFPKTFHKISSLRGSSTIQR